MSGGVIAVLPRACRALGDLANTAQASPIEVVSLREAFTKAWDYDAHFVSYITSPYDSSEPFFRLKKEILSEIRREGGDILITVVALDWDVPRPVGWVKEGHPRWEEVEGSWRSFQDLVLSAERDPLFSSIIKSTYISYATAKGFRWVFVLDTPIPADKGEEVIEGLIDFFWSLGIEVDKKCADWTRLFRLPSVLRSDEDGRTYRSDDVSLCPYYFYDLNERAVLSSSSVPLPASRKKSTPRPTEKVEHGEIPSDEEATSLLTCFDERGKQADTPFCREAKKALRGQSFYGHLFEMKKVTTDGSFLVRDASSRHEALLLWSLAASRCLVSNGIKFSTRHLYALFLPLAWEIEDRDGRLELWRACVGAVDITRAEIEQKKAEEIEISDRLTQAVRDWPCSPAVPQGPPEAWEWVKDRMIAVTSDTGHHYVLQKNGYFCSVGVKKGQLVPQVKNLEMHQVIDLVKPKADGEGFRRATYEEIVGDHAVVVSRIEVRPQIEGGYLDDLDKANPVLVLPSFRRNPNLVPCFNADVDLWVRALAGFTKKGRSLYETLCRHIGLFLAFERGAVCGMSFRIKSGAGKKLLAHGFMECLEEPALAMGRDLVDRNGPGLIKSPFVLLNEGWEDFGYTKPADAVRILISGDSFVVNRKYMPEQTVRFPYRLLLTANDEDLLLGLSKGDLAPDSREAIALRIQHYDPDEVPATLLTEKGEWAWTKGWIAGDGGEPSDFTVARHFLWLWEKYGKDATPTDRHGFLMAGDPECSPVDLMRTQGGSTPLVIEALLKKLNSPMGVTDGSVGIFVDRKSRGLFVTPAPLRDYALKELGQNVSSQKVLNSLKGLIKDGGLSGKKKVAFNGHEKRWIEIDTDMLLSEAEKFGWPSDGLTQKVLGLNGVVSANGNGRH